MGCFGIAIGLVWYGVVLVLVWYGIVCGFAIGLVWYGVVLVWYKLPTQGACRIHLLTIYCLLK